MTRRTPDVLRWPVRAPGMVPWCGSRCGRTRRAGSRSRTFNEHLVEPGIVDAGGRAACSHRTVRSWPSTAIPTRSASAAFGLLENSSTSQAGRRPGSRPMRPARAGRPSARRDSAGRMDRPLRATLGPRGRGIAAGSHTPPNGVTASITTWEYGSASPRSFTSGESLGCRAADDRAGKAFVEAEPGFETFGGHESARGSYIVGPTRAGPGDPDEYRRILRYRVRPISSVRAPGVPPSTALPVAGGSR